MRRGNERSCDQEQDFMLQHVRAEEHVSQAMKWRDECEKECDPPGSECEMTPGNPVLTPPTQCADQIPDSPNEKRENDR
jgi:hypothetical protein